MEYHFVFLEVVLPTQFYKDHATLVFYFYTSSEKLCPLLTLPGNIVLSTLWKVGPASTLDPTWKAHIIRDSTHPLLSKCSCMRVD
jgi:hypothetical protein